MKTKHPASNFLLRQRPGIYDIAQALRDGASTGGSLGAGFGTIRRLTDEFEIYSTVRTTTRLSLARAPHNTRHGDTSAQVDN
jgi:anti-sigma regulatory factor (Ser/Thr protein kinase)